MCVSGGLSEGYLVLQLAVNLQLFENKKFCTKSFHTCASFLKERRREEGA